MTEPIMLSCASLHKPSLANLSSLILSALCHPPKGWIVPLSPQVQSPALVQPHSPSPEPPLSLVVYCGCICCGTAGGLWHWALSCCPAGHQTKLSSVCVPQQLGWGGTRERRLLKPWFILHFLHDIITLERKELSQGKKFSCLHPALPQPQEIKWCSASQQCWALFAIYIIYILTLHRVMQWSQAKTLIQNNQRVGGSN